MITCQEEAEERVADYKHNDRKINQGWLYNYDLELYTRFDAEAWCKDVERAI